MKFVVVGCGSIGRRHIQNLVFLGVDEIVACDTDTDRLTYVQNEPSVKSCYNQFQDDVVCDSDGVLICTPPSSHVEIARRSIEKGVHVFIEKPISHTLEGIDELLEEGDRGHLTICIGYNFRFHPGVRKVKQIIDEGRIGKVLSVRAEFGQSLAEWRPWQDYRKSYTAMEALGGGIILDGSHEIDYLRYLVGEIKQVSCFAGRVSKLEVETEDVAEIILRFENDVLGSIHIDFFRPGYKRTCEVVGETGVVSWDYSDGSVKIYSVQSGKWEVINLEANDDKMYLNEMRHFINCVKGSETALVDGLQGKKSLEAALAVKESSKSGKIVEL